jgi:hypothetical protein
MRCCVMMQLLINSWNICVPFDMRTLNSETYQFDLAENILK